MSLCILSIKISFIIQLKWLGRFCTLVRFIHGFSKQDFDRKEKIGERIVALQQLVSPYGKTDTSSVLKEAMEYIGFLHKQLLSAPYLETTPAIQMQDTESCSLRSRGLCLFPVSFTIGVAEGNGADIWAPIKTTSPDSEKDVSQIQ
ncbi:hypothetical protein RYX36_008331 [Vicia faba]